MTRFNKIFWLIKWFFLGIFVLIVIGLLGFRWAASSRETLPLGAIPDQGGQIIETVEGDIYILERGPEDGISVLFAHGTAAWSGLWLPTLEAMAAKSYRAIGYDLPPFGFSSPATDENYSRQRQADRILALISSLDIRPIVVAHSVGAGPVAEAVLREPDAFSGLIIVDGAISLNSHLDPSKLPLILRSERVRELVVSSTVSNPYLIRKFLRDLIYIKGAANRKVISVLHQPMMRTGYTASVNQWVPSLLASPRDALSTQPKNWRDLNVPTILMWGEMDTITPLEQGEELSAIIPLASLVVMPNVGHIPQIEAPKLFQSELIGALTSLSEYVSD